jgi:hypothetical protein
LIEYQTIKKNRVEGHFVRDSARLLGFVDCNIHPPVNLFGGVFLRQLIIVYTFESLFYIDPKWEAIKNLSCIETQPQVL